jgi:hypothetical protein
MVDCLDSGDPVDGHEGIPMRYLRIKTSNGKLAPLIFHPSPMVIPKEFRQ